MVVHVVCVQVCITFVMDIKADHEICNCAIHISKIYIHVIYSQLMINHVQLHNHDQLG